MEYIVLRKRQTDDPWGQVPVDAGGLESAAALPISVLTADAANALGSQIALKIPVMPLELIEPMANELAPSTLPAVSWGIDAVKATDSKLTGEGVTVAVLDTGIQLDHPAFRDVELITKNFTEAPDEDTHGHGTHCAGTIFGRDVNGCRIGVARGVRRALIGKVIGPGGSTGSLVKAIQWAMQENAHIISMSLGFDHTKLGQALLEAGFPQRVATSQAMAAYASSVRLFDNFSRFALGVGGAIPGTLFVAATGNESKRDLDPRFTVSLSPPAVGEGVCAVGAVEQSSDTDSPYKIAYFSNTGPRLVAPGVNILSAKLGGGLAKMSGTSMATPHVAGVAALWAQRMLYEGRPINAQQLALRLETNARTLARPYEDVGSGLVQAP